MFTCPKCGTYRWGTSHCTEDYSKWIGHCNGYGCTFEWHRETDDDKYLSYKKAPDLDIKEALTTATVAVEAALALIPDGTLQNYKNKIYRYSNGDWTEVVSEPASIDQITGAYFDHHENRVRETITDPVQLEYFERWLRKEVNSPDPKDESLRQVYDAIVDLAMVGCG